MASTPPVEPDDSLIDDLTEQLERTRSLLQGDSEAAAESVLAQLGGDQATEAVIAVELAGVIPLLEPERFPDAHRLVMRALEVLDRHGWRQPRIPRLGPLGPLARIAVSFVAQYIVRGYANAIVNRLSQLYTRRESQAVPGTRERSALSRARVDLQRLAPDFKGGVTGLPAVVAGSASVSLLASASNYFGAFDYASRITRLIILAVVFLVFLALSWVLLQGAAVAHRRCRLIMRGPLAALWETIGHCGDPPRDQSRTFAIVAIALTTVAWFILPALAAVAALLT